MHWILKSVFFLSGATGLVYEVVWGRMLATILGSTVTAASIVMGVFLGGLALGARLFGVWGDGISRPLKMYAFLEAATGIAAIGVSLGLPYFQRWYPELVGLSGGNGVLALKIGIAAVFLLIPAMLMGGTLPVLSRHVVKSPQRLGNPVGTLYGLNTLGAFAGCLFSGFYSIEMIGLHGTTYLAAGINLGISFCCFFFFPEAPSSLAMSGDADPQVEAISGSGAFPMSHVPPCGFLVVYAISGATGLAYEVLWVRLLASTFIGTSYGFAAMLATCLGGMALGSLCFRKKSDAVANPLLWFGGMQLGLAFWAGAMLLPYNAFPVFQGVLSQYLGVSLGSQIVEMMVFSGILILVPAFLLGALFPLAARIWAGERGRVGENVGTLYTANTVGCVVGSLAAGLFALPYFGIQHSLVLFGVVNCALALYAVGISVQPVPKNRRVFAVAFGSLALLFLLVPGDLTARTMAHRLNKPWRLVYYDEGLDSNIMILQYKQTPIRRLMTTFHQYIGDTTEYMQRVQKLQAHLPILLKGTPEKVLFVGMGTGITPGAATAYSGEITCCEISREVMEASRFFATENKDVLHNPRVDLVREDGRHYLLREHRTYDLIVGDLYNAALAGMGNLYSREYYSLCLSRLHKDGMMCQWVSMKDIPEKELRSVMATFGSVFPHTALWYATPDILAMIGTREPLHADLKRIQRDMKSPGLREILAEIGLDNPFSLLAHFLMNQKAWDAFAAGAQIITDDRPSIEYSIPRSLHYLRYKEEIPVTLRHVIAGRSFLVPPEKKPASLFGRALAGVVRAQSHLFEGYAAFLEGHLAAAGEEYGKALSLNPHDMDARLLRGILDHSRNVSRHPSQS